MSNSVEIVSTLANVLERLVKTGDSFSTQHNPTIFHAVRPPAISIRKYLERIVRYSVCNTECFIIGLVFIDRITQQNHNFTISSLNIHRLLITSFMLASKFYDDCYYNNAYFAKVGGLPTSELNTLELEFLFLSHFSLFVEPDVFYRYRRELAKHTTKTSVPQPLPKPIAAPPPKDVKMRQSQYGEELKTGPRYAPELHQR